MALRGAVRLMGQAPGVDPKARLIALFRQTPDEAGRKTVIVAYQQRKLEEVPHRGLDRKVPLGLVPHVQARLLARHLRGDLEHYPPYLMR